MKEMLRLLPAVHEIQKDHRFQQLVEQLGNEKKMITWLREELNIVRQAILDGKSIDSVTEEDMSDYLLKCLEAKLNMFEMGNIRHVINATGTILHTNFGRAVLSKEAIHKVSLAAEYYTNLEFDIVAGKRGSRHTLVEQFITELTGAEAAMVVNNNAAAVYLVLRALAKEKEVIVSRGQLVEIGGSFRVSSIMEESGANLIEVGTTNKTHIYDYENAISDQTAMLMKVHTSNFRTIGFTSEVTLEEMADIAERHPQDILVYEDLGSGAIYDFKQHQIGSEPTVKEALKNGADIVTFSGDKLLGGPQAGIIAGNKFLIDKIKMHQLARVLRVDKMTLAALEETFKTYVKGESSIQNIPAVRMILETQQEIEKRVRVFLKELELQEWGAEVSEDVSKIGGGTMPEVTLPTAVLCIDTGNTPVQRVEKLLRTKCIPAVAARVKENKLIFDFRTIAEEEYGLLRDALMKIEGRMVRN